MNLSKSGPSLRIGGRGAGVTFGHGHIRQTIGLPGTGMYWTSVSGTGRRQTRRVASRAIRRAPPPASRPQLTPQQNRQAAIGCLWVIGVVVGLAIVVATYGVALIPLGLFVWWRVHHRHQQPSYIAGELIKKAAVAPLPDAVHLYHQAMDADPNGAVTLMSAGSWFYQHSCWSDAADAYAGYLHLAKDSDVEQRYAASLLAAGHPDEAITEYQNLAAEFGQIPERMISELAGAFLIKGDAGQALAIAKEAPLQRHQLDNGLQRALMARASAEYFLGQKAKAVSDLERLYAVNPNFPNVSETKQRMSEGTFQIEKPAVRPPWYPSEVELREGPAVEQVQDGHAQELAAGSLSPDGVWSWTGYKWVPASESISPPAPILDSHGQAGPAPQDTGMPAAVDPSVSAANVAGPTDVPVATDTPEWQPPRNS
jgi:tetratricopeptide (TPR) repeat protein